MIMNEIEIFAGNRFGKMIFPKAKKRTPFGVHGGVLGSAPERVGWFCAWGSDHVAMFLAQVAYEGLRLGRWQELG
jgi:hypothetical protein